MPNPYAPRRPRRGSRETLSELDHFLVRLQGLGATADELAGVRDGWDQFDDEWTPRTRAAFIRLPDGDLMDALRDTRDGNRGIERHNAEVEAGEAVREVIGRSVGDVVAWVDGSPVRAWVALAADRGNRKTLTQALSGLAQDWADGA